MSRILRASALLLLSSVLCGCSGLSVDDEFAQVWLTQLRSPEESLRIGAAASLGAGWVEGPVQIREIVAALERALDDPSSAVVEAAARSLGNLGSRAAPALEALLRTAQSGGVKLRFACWRAIPRLGEVALPAIRQALADPDPRVRRGVVMGLGMGRLDFGISLAGRPGRIPRNLIPLLVDALRDDDAIVRSYAVWGLGLCQSSRPVVLRALIRALRDESWVVQLSAINALKAVGPSARSAVPHLRAMLRPQRDLKPWLLELHVEPSPRLRKAIDEALKRLRG